MRISLVAILFFALTPFSALSDVFELANGDKIDAKILEENDKTIVVDHPQLGKIVIQRDALKPPTPPNPGVFGTQILAGWNRNFGAGVSGSSGNSSDASFNASLALGRETDRYRAAFNTSYFFASQQGNQTTNEFFTNYQHDFLFKDSPLYVFVQTRYQYDAFQAWENRTSGSGGLGYTILARKNFNLRGELGVGYSHSWGTEPGWKPEGVVGLVFDWSPMEGQKLTADITYYPDFENFSEFRILANAAYIVAITQLDGLSLKVGIKEEYDSDQPGKNNNLKYFGNLVYDF
ncbi:MAG: DUF481 domain-containing protein [Myxococcota bacterium]|nr:DUF481 domain-containing protein [Myxococcota bacterium]